MNASSHWEIVTSPEVEDWIMSLPLRDLMVVDHMMTMLSEQGHKLSMPHSKSLGGGLHELRFDLQQGTVAQRVTYFFRGDVIALTTFRKTRQVEAAQIKRARRAMEQYKRQVSR